jgi:hypothetical protein
MRISFSATPLRTGARFPLPRQLASIVAWAVACSALGLVVGLAAVFLPPLVAFGMVVIPEWCCSG